MVRCLLSASVSGRQYAVICGRGERPRKLQARTANSEVRLLTMTKTEGRGCAVNHPGHNNLAGRNHLNPVCVALLLRGFERLGVRQSSQVSIQRWKRPFDRC